MPPSDTQDYILNNIPGIDDVDPAPSGGAQTDGGGQSDAGADGGRQQPATSAPPTDRTQPQQTDQQQQQDIPRRLPQNEQRDLVDPVTGQVVAKGGIERRVYERADRALRENQRLTRELQQRDETLRGYGEVMRVGQETGVSVQDQVNAIRVYADFMRDPVRVLTSLVEEVKARGYPLPFLTEGVTPGMDLNAIGRMIDGKMQPLVAERTERQRQEEVQRNAARELDTFIDKYPDARHNLDIIGRMMERDRGLSLQDAYMQLFVWCQNSGYDISQNVLAQVQAARQAHGEPKQPSPQEMRRPLPNGRSANGGGVQDTQNTQSFDENASWSDIIRHSMRQAGMGDGLR